VPEGCVTQAQGPGLEGHRTCGTVRDLRRFHRHGAARLEPFALTVAGETTNISTTTTGRCAP